MTQIPLRPQCPLWFSFDFQQQNKTQHLAEVLGH